MHLCSSVVEILCFSPFGSSQEGGGEWLMGEEGGGGGRLSHPCDAETLSLVWDLVPLGEWIQHHNDQAKYLRSPYSASIMKPFYRGHHWNLDIDFMPERAGFTGPAVST